MENKLNNTNNWPFINDGQVIGMKLPEYLDWATDGSTCPKELLLPPIQRGFVWKTKQIVDLWDSLLRGMPIGSLMLSKLSNGQVADTLGTQGAKKTKEVSREAMGLLDGQQRTLAMLIGWPASKSTQHCLWIDLAENGPAGSPFDIRLTTQAQPFGFQRVSHSRLSKHDRKQAREHYDKLHPNPENKPKPDYKLFDLGGDQGLPHPWKAKSEPNQFVKVKDLWRDYRKTCNDKTKFLALYKDNLADERLSDLHDAFTRLESLEVPLILIPEHIGKSKMEVSPNEAPHPLVLLFERIGRNGASLSAEDLLFSMIKHQWPKAQEWVNKIHNEVSVRAFMSATDYVMSAYRLGAAEVGITDNPRPSPNDFHRHLGAVIGMNEEKSKPLRDYLDKDNPLELAFKSLFDLLAYRKDMTQDIGLPLPMMPHLPRGLTQVLLRWIMLNPDSRIIEDNREKVIAFGLFWYLNVLHDDKASKMAFDVINKGNKDNFPANELYKALIASPNLEEVGLALPLESSEEIKKILNRDMCASPRTYDAIFNHALSKSPQRELYKRFCWRRKPILLWLQREYVTREFDELFRSDFGGLTDEDTVPYDFDHLCPQNHWGADWRNIFKVDEDRLKDFYDGRHISGNCIGNFHVLESSLNRSFGDAALAQKVEAVIESGKWRHEDSLLYDFDLKSKNLWGIASPIADETVSKTWSPERLEAFQGAVYGRAFGLYSQYYEACKRIVLE